VAITLEIRGDPSGYVKRAPEKLLLLLDAERSVGRIERQAAATLFVFSRSQQQKGSEQYNTRFWSWSKVKFYGQGEEAPRMWWSSSFCVTKGSSSHA